MSTNLGEIFLVIIYSARTGEGCRKLDAVNKKPENHN